MTLRGSLFQIYTLTENFIVKKEGGRIKHPAMSSEMEVFSRFIR